MIPIIQIIKADFLQILQIQQGYIQKRVCLVFTCLSLCNVCPIGSLFPRDMVCLAHMDIFQVNFTVYSIDFKSGF